jgi:hypothetical protein
LWPPINIFDVSWRSPWRPPFSGHLRTTKRSSAQKLFHALIEASSGKIYTRIILVRYRSTLEDLLQLALQRLRQFLHGPHALPQSPIAYSIRLQFKTQLHQVDPSPPITSISHQLPVIVADLYQTPTAAQLQPPF